MIKSWLLIGTWPQPGKSPPFVAIDADEMKAIGAGFLHALDEGFEIIKHGRFADFKGVNGACDFELGGCHVIDFG